MVEDNVIINESPEDLKGVAKKVFDIANNMENTIQAAIQKGYNAAIETFKNKVDSVLDTIIETQNTIIAIQENLIPKPLQTFTVGASVESAETYTFEEGMTWEEWLNSVYNTAGFYYDNGTGVRNADDNFVVYATLNVSKSELIVADRHYFLN